MRTELAALRSVPTFRRAIAVSLALAGMLTINFLGLKDLATTTAEDARSALSSGAVAGFVAIAYAAGSAGAEMARGGLALALLSTRATRAEAVRARLGAYAAAGGLLGAAGAAMAARPDLPAARARRRASAARGPGGGPRGPARWSTAR